jgi:hypothetical protein
MPLARLLTAALVCCVPAVAQIQIQTLSEPVTALLQAGSTQAGHAPGVKTNQPSATSSDPWRIIPQNPDPNFAQDWVERLRTGQNSSQNQSKDARDSDTLQTIPARPPQALDLQSQGDTTCYAIRSYVVARDNRDSDSTHSVGYSTCRPASRYNLKSAEIRQGSPDR